MRKYTTYTHCGVNLRDKLLIITVETRGVNLNRCLRCATNIARRHHWNVCV